MAFYTPQQPSGRDQPQPTSLLFSPAFKPTDGGKMSPAAGRTPSGTPGIFGPPGGQSRGERSATPASRRRSLTPASSLAKDTPPPPPGESLLDSLGVTGPYLAGWATAQSEYGGVEDMATSPIGSQQPAGVAPTTARDAGGTALVARHYMAPPPPYESTWITVFGFSQVDAPLVLREFSKCGDIIQFGTFDDGPGVNWLHINYSENMQNKHAAQRALLRNGDRLSPSCMVGVKALETSKRDAIERQGQAVSQGAKGISLPMLASARPYQVNATSQTAVVPLSSKSAWKKVSEFILGL